MAEYYYFVSSLPSVWMDKDSPITYSEFLECAKTHLSKSDYKDLLKATFAHDQSDSGKNHIVKEWDDFIFKLNELLTQERAKKLGLLDPSYKARCTQDMALEESVRRIVGEENALKAEKMILSLYFDFLDQHQLSSPFSTDALIIYGLKLQIKERASAFDREKGKAEFERLFSNIEKDIFIRSDYGKE